MKYKNAISGLVVVVLLVAVAVAITAMFVSWLSSMAGKSITNSQSGAQKAEICSNLQYNVQNIKITDHGTYSTFDVIIQNTGKYLFNGMAVRVFAKNGSSGSVDNKTAGAWVKTWFTQGSIGEMQTGDLIFNVSIPKSSLASLQYFPLVNTTVPSPITVMCSDAISTQDLSQYVSTII